ncbi:MAG: glycosyltransferase family 4 protein [Victivallales bacterium]|nr:glycosyltransferase family 4 protein [Victivallales bacterium]
MNILIALYRYFFWGGLQKDTLRLAEEATKRGHRVTVFTTSWENPPDFITTVQVKPCGLTNVSRMRHFNEAWLRYLRENGCDVSVAMDRVEGADFYFAADSCLKAFYKRKHPEWMLKLLPRYRFILGMEEKVCGAASPTVTWYISPFQKKEFMEEYGTSASHLQELPPGMNPACVRPDEQRALEIRQAVRRELGIRDDEIVLVLVGTNILRKGMDRLLAAAASLPGELRAKVRVVIVGNNDTGKLETIAGKLGVWSQCILTGARKDVERILLGSDLMVHPAREEGTGTVLVEGIAAGVPVICSECCGFSPYVKAAAGLVTPEPFVQENLNAMLLDALRRLPELIAQTRLYAKQNDFTTRQKVMVDNLEAFYKRKQ